MAPSICILTMQRTQNTFLITYYNKTVFRLWHGEYEKYETHERALSPTFIMPTARMMQNQEIKSQWQKAAVWKEKKKKLSMKKNVYLN